VEQVDSIGYKGKIMAILADIEQKRQQFIVAFQRRPNLLLIPLDQCSDFEETVKAMLNVPAFLKKGDVDPYMGMRVMPIVGPLSVALEVQNG
jgi:hypothetical protein